MSAVLFIEKAIWRGVVRRRTFEVHSMNDVIVVLGQLSDERHTGPITVNMSQGGVSSVIAEDRAVLST